MSVVVLCPHRARCGYFRVGSVGDRNSLPSGCPNLNRKCTLRRIYPSKSIHRRRGPRDHISLGRRVLEKCTRKAGLRVDHLLLTPDLVKRLKRSEVDTGSRRREKLATMHRCGSS